MNLQNILQLVVFNFFHKNKTLGKTSLFPRENWGQKERWLQWWVCLWLAWLGGFCFLCRVGSFIIFPMFPLRWQLWLICVQPWFLGARGARHSLWVSDKGLQCGPCCLHSQIGEFSLRVTCEPSVFLPLRHYKKSDERTRLDPECSTKAQRSI